MTTSMDYPDEGAALPLAGRAVRARRTRVRGHVHALQRDGRTAAAARRPLRGRGRRGRLGHVRPCSRGSSSLCAPADTP